MTNNNDDFSLTWKLYSTCLFRKSLLVSCQKLTRYNHLPLYGVYVNFGSNLQMMFMFMLSWLLLSFCWNFYFFLTIIMIIIGNNNDLGDIYINVLAWLNPTFHCIIIMKKCLLSLNGIHFNVIHSLLWNDHNRELILVFDRCTFYGASCFWTHTISFLIITNLTGQTCLDFVFFVRFFISIMNIFRLSFFLTPFQSCCWSWEWNDSLFQYPNTTMFILTWLFGPC